MPNWNNPKTWNVGEIVTASSLNTHLRDNTLYLKDVLTGNHNDARLTTVYTGGEWTINGDFRSGTYGWFTYDGNTYALIEPYIETHNQHGGGQKTYLVIRVQQTGGDWHHYTANQTTNFSYSPGLTGEFTLRARLSATANRTGILRLVRRLDNGTYGFGSGLHDVIKTFTTNGAYQDVSVKLPATTDRFWGFLIRVGFEPAGLQVNDVMYVHDVSLTVGNTYNLYPHVGYASITDQNIGAGVPILTRRSGGNATNWDNAGSTTYNTGVFKQLIGASGPYTLSNGSQSTAVSVNFPEDFSGIPMFIPSVRITNGSNGLSVTVNNITTGSASVYVERTPSNPSNSGDITFTINWVAIGPR